MFKKTIKFTNFNDEEVSKDFYFHLSKSELLTMASDGKTMQARIEKIIATKDIAGVLAEFRVLIRLSVGVRSEDGTRFIKDSDAQSHLLDSPAYDELLFELLSKPDYAAEFVNKLVPEKLQKELEKELRKQEPNVPEDARPAYQKEGRSPTKSELEAMSKAEMAEAFSWAQRNQVVEAQ